MNSNGLRRAGLLETVIISVLLASATAWSQVRYSVNALAYVDANFVAGSNLMANPLNATDNSVSNLFRGVPDGTYFMSWKSVFAGFNPPNIYSNATGWATPGELILPPFGGFLVLPSATKITFLGEPPPTLCVNYVPSGTLSGLMPRLACAFCENINGDCPAPIPDGTQMYKWNRTSQETETYSYYYDFGGWQSQWGIPGEPTLEPAESALFAPSSTFTAKFMGAGGTLAQGAVTLDRFSRSGNSFNFGFATSSNTAYALLCASNLNSKTWQVVQRGSLSSTGGVASLSIPAMTNKSGFYRLIGAYHSTNAYLMNPSRGTNEFQCEFYAPVTATYELQRILVWNNPNTQTWQTVASIAGQASNIVTIVDGRATNASGYYRLRY
jgi:hypothetical protein